QLPEFQNLSNLFQQMSDYNKNNQKVAGDAWEDMFDGYVKDVEKAAKEKAKKEGLLGLIWDTLQVAAGAVIAVVGLGLTPFTGGASLGLTIFGASLVVGGVNSGINHASMAIRGEGLNLVGMASEKVGAWYSKNIAQPAKDSGQPWLEFLAGVGGAAGEMVSGMAQMNVVEISKSVGTLITSPEARKQMGAGIGEWWKQVRSGNAYVIGETVFNVAGFFVGASEVQAAFKVARGGQATSILSKGGAFVKALGKEGASNAKNLFTMPSRVVDNISSNGKKFMQNLEEVFSGKNSRYAFAGVGDSESILNKVTRNSDVVTKNDVQRNFMEVTGQPNPNKVTQTTGRGSASLKGNTKLSPDDFDFDDKGFNGKLRGDKQSLPDVNSEKISYVKRSPSEAAKLRREFDSKVKSEFLKDLSQDVEKLKQAGLSEADILKLSKGKSPGGKYEWQVHHQLPLDDSGTNDFSNLVLIKNDPYHKVITNYQNIVKKGLGVGEGRLVDWPMIETNIYPSQALKGGK
ncbi:HNH endonuclease signature motif containing protein, partial [Pseudolactococcus yaeyamensis]